MSRLNYQAIDILDRDDNVAPEIWETIIAPSEKKVGQFLPSSIKFHRITPNYDQYLNIVEETIKQLR